MPETTVEYEAAVDAALLEVAERFAIVPEWLLDADISDTAIRLYAVLLRYGQSSGARMPGRATLARRLHKRSVDTIDRAMRELVAVGAVTVEHRYAGGRRLTNRYHLNAHPPDGPTAAGMTAPAGHDVARQDRAGSRTPAATRAEFGQVERGVERAGGRMDAAGVAATVRHNPEHFTQTNTSSTPQTRDDSEAVGVVNRWRVEEDRFLERLGITDADAFTAEVANLRRDAGGPSARWARPSLVAALQAAVKARGWPAQHAAAALRIVAADPATRSPMRVAEAGPWWDDAALTTPATQPERAHASGGADELSLEQVEAELTEADGLRVRLQADARQQLRAEGQPVTRATVLRRAHQLLQLHRRDAAVAV